MSTSSFSSSQGGEASNVQYLLEAPPGSLLRVRRDVGGVHVPDEVDRKLPLFEVQLLHQPGPIVRRGGICDAPGTKGGKHSYVATGESLLLPTAHDASMDSAKIGDS